MSANPAFILIGVGIISLLVLTNKKLRFIAAGVFAFFFTLNIMVSDPEVITDSLDKTVKPVTALWHKCQTQMDAGEKTCDVGK